MASSLYLGVLTGYSMLWLQPLAMLFGIVMLSALGYITIVTGERPVQAINKHINPVLGWGWALAALLASMVWALPQFSLANGVMQQNLMPDLLGPDGTLGGFTALFIVSVSILCVTYFVTWNYNRDRTGVRVYELILKIVVAIIVISFMGVVIRLTFITGTIDWAEAGRGLIPNPALIFRPAEGFLPLLEGLSETSRAYWTDIIVTRQQNVMAAAFSSAVGINMTFLFAYSMLRRKWGPEYRGLMKFDLIGGMLIPFMMVTSCVVIASTSQFHTVPQPGIIDEYAAEWEPDAGQVNEYYRMLEGRVAFEAEGVSLSQAELESRIEMLSRDDHIMAATLITRDAFDLSFSLEPLLGDVFGQIIFGIGVLGMALSSITLMMIVSGFVVCEVFRKPYTGWTFRLGAMLPGIGVLGPFFWDQAYFWLAIPTSVITFMLLPIAYITFLLMMNSRPLMGGYMPVGRNRVIWNTFMILSVTIITSASLYMLWTRGGSIGLGALIVFLLAVGFAEWQKRGK
jgi:Mn2+/Fe2+ NRAMP family transporter